MHLGRVGKVALALTGLLLLTALLSACQPPFQDDLDELQVDVARLEESTQRAQILAALEPLNPLRYHQLDAIVRNNGRIPTDAVIWATRARETLAWVSWPAELSEHVNQYAEWLDSLLDAFLADDAAAASEPSRIVHALAHTFEATLEAWLDHETLPAVPPLAGLEPPAHDEHGQHSQQTMQSMSHDQSQDEHGDHE